MEKKMHRFTHATATEMKMLLRDSVHSGEDLTRACEKVYRTCDICASSERKGLKRKVSLSHVNAAFNVEVQADFLVVHAGGYKYEILNMIDVGTGYGERSIAPSRSADVMRQMMEVGWLYRHGATKTFSADPEFCRSVLKTFLESNKVTLADCPPRSSHKNGIFERKTASLRRYGREYRESRRQHLPRYW